MVRFDEFGNKIAGCSGDDDDEPRIQDVTAIAGPEGGPASAAATAAGEVQRADVEESVDDRDRSDANFGFDDDVEVVVDDEPEGDLSTMPLVAPSDTSAPRGETLLIEGRKASVPADFVDMLASTEARNRSFAIVGDLHHGKTSFLRLLGGGVDIAQRPDERERCISLKSNLVTVMAKGRQKPATFLLSALDTPGHVDFGDEVAASLRLVDGAVLCVDVVEGLLTNGERIIRNACIEGVRILLVITKFDRLVLDLKLPPADAYFKLKHIIDQVNNVILGCGSEHLAVSPHTQTVAFCSEKLGIFFTLLSFARVYAASHTGMDPQLLAHRLWGEVSYDVVRRRFVKSVGPGRKETFVSFILEPIYKIVGHSITGKGAKNLRCEGLSELPASPIAAATEALTLFLGDARSTAVDAIVDAVPTSGSRNAALLQRYQIDDAEPFAAVASLQRAFSSSEVVAVARVIRGRLIAGAALDVLNGGSSDTISLPATAAELVLKSVDGWVSIVAAPAGQLVHVKGISDAVHKGAVLLSHVEGRIDRDDLALPTVPALYFQPPMLRIGVEPVTDKEAPALQHGLGIINKTYVGCEVTIEASGERTIAAPGELYLDTLLHDLRAVLCKGISIKLSDPYVPFRESVTEPQGQLVFEGMSDCRVSLTAGALDPALGLRLEGGGFAASAAASLRGTLDRAADPLCAMLRNDFHWDVLDSVHVIALGPDRHRGSCLLVDDTLASEPLGRDVRETIALGFARATAEGPLCGEPMRNVRFTVIDALTRGGWQRAGLLASAREAAHQAVFGARACLLEPIFRMDIMLSSAVQADKVGRMLLERRGQVVASVRVPGTPLQVTKALIPAIDMFGFEVSLRAELQGAAFPVAVFDHWATVPGDPFDTSVEIPPLVAARGHQLAADFVLKTRARKGKKDIRLLLDR